MPIDTTYNSPTFSRILRKGCAAGMPSPRWTPPEAWEARHASEDDFVEDMAFTQDEMAAFKRLRCGGGRGGGRRGVDTLVARH